MKTSIFHPLVVGWQSALVASPALASDSYDLRPFHVNLSENVPHMLDLIRQTHLPGAPEYPDIGASAGIGLDVLKSLQEQWLNGFNWDKEQASMNQLALIQDPVRRASLTVEVGSNTTPRRSKASPPISSMRSHRTQMQSLYC